MCWERCTPSIRRRCGVWPPLRFIVVWRFFWVCWTWGSTVTRCGFSVQNSQAHPLGMWCGSGSGVGFECCCPPIPQHRFHENADSISLAWTGGGRSSCGVGTSLSIPVVVTESWSACNATCHPICYTALCFLSCSNCAACRAGWWEVCTHHHDREPIFIFKLTDSTWGLREANDMCVQLFL